jgi:hypothetical protein
MTDIPYEFNSAILSTPGGTVSFVTAGDGLYFDPNRCVATQNVRAPHTNIPQGDGAHLHTGYFGLVLITLVGIIRAEVTSTRTSLADGFIAACRSLLSADGTYTWTPAGSGGRAVTVRLADSSHPEVSGGLIKEFRVTLRASNP